VSAPHKAQRFTKKTAFGQTQQQRTAQHRGRVGVHAARQALQDGAQVHRMLYHLRRRELHGGARQNALIVGSAQLRTRSARASK
jgi:hypothetical protein